MLHEYANFSPTISTIISGMQDDDWGPFLPVLPWQVLIIYQLAVQIIMKMRHFWAWLCIHMASEEQIS